MPAKKKAPTIPPVPIPPGVDSLLGPGQVTVVLGLVSRRMLYRMIARGDFPKPDVPLAPKMPRWSVGLFNRWVAERVAASKP